MHYKHLSCLKLKKVKEWCQNQQTLVCLNSVTIEVKMQQTLVFVSHRTSSCCTRNERWPANWLPKHHGKQWQPGSSTSSNFPNCSLIATLDWSTWIQQKACPIVMILQGKWKLWRSGTSAEKIIQTNIHLMSCIALMGGLLSFHKDNTRTFNTNIENKKTKLYRNLSTQILKIKMQNFEHKSVASLHLKSVFSDMQNMLVWKHKKF